jgi:hypothetical protein
LKGGHGPPGCDPEGEGKSTPAKRLLERPGGPCPPWKNTCSYTLAGTSNPHFPMSRRIGPRRLLVSRAAHSPDWRPVESARARNDRPCLESPCVGHVSEERRGSACPGGGTPPQCRPLRSSTLETVPNRRRVRRKPPRQLQVSETLRDRILRMPTAVMVSRLVARNHPFAKGAIVSVTKKEWQLSSPSHFAEGRVMRLSLRVCEVRAARRRSEELEYLSIIEVVRLVGFQAGGDL